MINILAQGLDFPEGPAFAPDGGLWLVELKGGKLTRVAGGKLERFATDGAPPGPDGMAFGAASGANGLLHVAVYPHGQIKTINAAGEIVRTIDLPGKNPTNVAFDPSGKLGMVVTEAEKGLLLSLPGSGSGARLFDGRLLI